MLERESFASHPWTSFFFDGLRSQRCLSRKRATMRYAKPTASHRARSRGVLSLYSNSYQPPVPDSHVSRLYCITNLRDTCQFFVFPFIFSFFFFSKPIARTQVCEKFRTMKLSLFKLFSQNQHFVLQAFIVSSEIATFKIVRLSDLFLNQTLILI